MADLYAAPGATFGTSASNAPTGLVGTIGVRVLDSDGVTVVPRTTAGVVEQPPGSGLYFAELTAPAVRGTYTILWDTGTVSPTTTTADVLVVTFDTPGEAIGGPDLVSLAEFREALGIDPTYTLDDLKIAGFIPYASKAVLSYTQRAFGEPAVTETRNYTYDGSGFLDIDDASTVLSVAFLYPGGAPSITLDADSWTARPGPLVFYYVELPDYIGQVSGSPEMGFTRNLDVYARERGGYGASNKVAVTATYGWPSVPEDVKLAVIWTIQSWIERPSGELTSEAIEGWSRSWGRNGSSAAAEAIPERARDLLAAYSRIEA